MKQKVAERLAARKFRERGYSVNEIADRIGVAKSSISVWVRNVPLTEKGRARLLTRIKLGQLLSAENKRRKTQETIKGYRKEALEELNAGGDSISRKILCSLLYWCEGAKNHLSGARFTNSDPKLIRAFLVLFRNSFQVDESKIRIGLHLHEYHNTERQIDFWSRITMVPKRRFIKPYRKPHTGKRVRDEYPGCATIYYHSNMVARRLLATAEVFLDQLGA